MPSAGLGFVEGPWGLSDVLGSSEASAREGEWRKDSMGAVSSADGTGGAARGGEGVSLVWPFGSRFAAAMPTQPWGSVYVPGRGWISRWRQPIARGQGVALYQPFEKGSVQG
jgi:hypothetical protein